ncbi:acyl-CoA dehydrogenase family protein [Actinomadura sp. WMMB 499]|uniref:acyl-CoA dehydrogenase family protein n=1 Tax=Actinomadura sp. WMMB 499 TaxID=1219491 RepID=UPI001244D11C|nr:acyl-CoA dehydrogenase family protein [Actinomadura sp. WMMB 499]QFG24459.1 hydroxylase [Actinomadura sp. WMMB 499]
MTNRVLDTIMERAEEIRELGPVNERLGKLDDKAAKVLRDAAVIRMLQPAAHGGLEAHPRDFAETVMGIAALDGSTGWVAGIVGLHPWEMAMADPKVQQEIWGDDPDTWIASPYAPMGVARPVDGGYIFNGRWQFSSGTDHCDWIFLGAMLGDKDGKVAQPPNSLHMILPRSDYEIVEDSWNVAGLKGTGSKDIIVRDAFVPEYRTIPFSKIIDGTAPREAGLTNPTFLVPFSCAFPLGITSAVIGIAEGALAHHLAYQRQRVQITGTKIKDDPYVLYAISEAAEEIKASRTALIDNASRMYDKAAAGEEFSFAERAAGRRTQVRAAWRAVQAMNEIVVRSGGNAMRTDNPIQRFWRDAHVGLAHAIHVPGAVYHVSALTDLDIEPPQGPMRSMI